MVLFGLKTKAGVPNTRQEIVRMILPGLERFAPCSV